MTKPDGLHHLAVTTADIKTQIAFFSDVLGTELVALYWMHGVKGAWHGFVKLNDTCSIAFVQSPDIAKVKPEIGVTHSGNAGAPCAPGIMQHLALNVKDDAELLAMRDRIRSRGIIVFGPIDHGFCKSLYFAGPEHMTLEIATQYRILDAPTWIDPEVLASLGVSAEETAAMINPAPYTGPANVPQPAFDPAKPHLDYPEDAYARMLATPDSVYEGLAPYEPPARTG